MDNFSNQHWNQNQQNNQQQNRQQTDHQQNTQQSQQQPSMIMKLMSSCLPVLIEQFTGQNMPMGGNNTETQMMLMQISTQQQLIINSQQALEQRLTSLETRANQQFSGLVQQVKNLKGIRLTQERERKQIELQGDVSDFNKSRQFGQNSENNEN